MQTDVMTQSRVQANQRTADRVPVSVPARLTWKDSRGATRFASVVTRNVSEFGVYVECITPVSIPLYRLVQIQLDREGASSLPMPHALVQGRVLSAVYRVSPPAKARPQGFALRLMVDPRRALMPERARATA
jgi:hypothetical protein